MGQADDEQHDRMILIEEFEKHEAFAELSDVMDEIRSGRHGPGIAAALRAMARVRKEEKWNGGK